MREIKFRAWDKNLKQWLIEERLQPSGTSTKDLSKYDIQKQYDLDWCQYTGLKDKNGVGIYEGDIVRYTPAKETTKSGLPFIDMPVEWYQPKAKFVMWLHDHSMYQPIQTALRPNHEVIGNVHQNPELLNGNNS